MESSKFKLSVDGIEISGSQEFVEEQLRNYKSLIESSYAKILERDSHTTPLNQNVDKRLLMLNNPSVSRPSEEVEFVEVKPTEVNHENVYVYEGDNFQLIADMPNGSTRSKMLNVVLVYMYASLKKGIESVSFNELRSICMHAGEFDGSNFARVMEDNKKYFLLIGEHKSKTAKLIRPGIKEAERLISELNK